MLSLKHLEFFRTEEEQTEVWLGSIYRAFERFFKENTLPLPATLKESLVDKSSAQIAQAIREWWQSQKADDLKKLVDIDTERRA
jgi:hypothetical protein